MQPTALLPLWRKSCYGFLSPQKTPSSSAGFEPDNLGSNGKHATTTPPKATWTHVNYFNQNRFINVLTRMANSYWTLQATRVSEDASRLCALVRLACFGFTTELEQRHQPKPQTRGIRYSIAHKWGSRVSSGSIVSDCGLDDRAIGVRSPAGAEDFSSSLCVQTGSEAQPASCTMGTGGPFAGGKARPGRDADHSPPSSDEVVKWVGAIPPLPPSASMTCRGTAASLFKESRKSLWS
jgi:hypothetical protein